MPCEQNHFLSMVVGHRVISASTLATPGVQGVKSCYFPVTAMGVQRHFFQGKFSTKLKEFFFSNLIKIYIYIPPKNVSISQYFS